MTHFLAQVLLGLFIAGWIGCAITIPMAAFKYASVLFERDEPEDEGATSRPQSQAADD